MKKRSQQGFSLIELMIALVISMVLMAGVLTIMSTSKRTYALQDELARLQEDARFVIEELSYGLRMAGYFGCSGRLRGINKPSPITVINNRTVQTEEGGTLAKYTPPSDVLTLSYFGMNGRLRLPDPPASTGSGGGSGSGSGSGTGGSGTEPPSLCPSSAELCKEVEARRNYIENSVFAQQSNQIVVHADNIFPQDGQQIIISDCGGAELYTVQGAPTISAKTAMITLDRQHRIYNWPVEIYPMPTTAGATVPTVTYEVKAVSKDGDSNYNEDIDGYALFRNDELLVEGVQNLQIRYGLDTDRDGVVDRYVDGSSTPIGDILTVQVNLLMRTVNKRFDLVGTTDTEFELTPDLSYKPSNEDYLKNEEGYRHRFFTMTVKVRNSS